VGYLTFKWPGLTKRRYGDILVRTCKSYKHGDQEIRESILWIEVLWSKIQAQLELLRKIWPSLDEDYQIHQNSVLQVLHGKAQAAISLVDSVIGNSEESTVKTILSKKGEARRLKYAIWVKNSLQNVLLDLKEWAEIFDVSWYLIIRQTSKEIDQELQPIATNEDEPLSTLKGLRDAIKSNLVDEAEGEKSTVFLPSGLFEEDAIELSNSDAEIWRSADGQLEYLVDPPSGLSTLADSCKLAKILQKVEPLKFGVLKCKGLVKVPPAASSPSRFVFSIPSDFAKPQYLRTMLMSGAESVPLDEKFEVAKQLAKAVMFIHSAGFVHKNIRPETILILRSLDVDSLNTESFFAFLTGFENFRLAEGKTQYQGDNFWGRNLYRHPTRQGIRPEDDYTMQHDIYSLGVCLLEIGIGSSLIISEGKVDSGKFSEENDSKPSHLLQGAIDPSLKDQKKRAFAMKRWLVAMSKEQLPRRMGRKYTELVVTCLACLDRKDNSFGVESDFFDENGILVGVRFIEKVCLHGGQGKPLLIGIDLDSAPGVEDLRAK